MTLPLLGFVYFSIIYLSVRMPCVSALWDVVCVCVNFAGLIS